MKKLKEMYEELEKRNDFRILQRAFDGGKGMFTKGSCKGMTVVWSYAGGWEHVSIDGKRRTPTWDEMCNLKDMFWDKDECCVQYHPAEHEYINFLPYCLHIWKPIGRYAGRLPVPPAMFTGPVEEK